MIKMIELLLRMNELIKEVDDMSKCSSWTNDQDTKMNEEEKLKKKYVK